MSPGKSDSLCALYIYIFCVKVSYFLHHIVITILVRYIKCSWYPLVFLLHDQGSLLHTSCFDFSEIPIFNRQTCNQESFLDSLLAPIKFLISNLLIQSPIILQIVLTSPSTEMDRYPTNPYSNAPAQTWVCNSCGL